MAQHHSHIVTPEFQQRVCDLVMSGAPIHIICEILKIDNDTLKKYYSYELKTAKAIAIERIGKTVYQQAVEGDSKAQALYLKTQGSSQGWIEKQVIETVDTTESQALRDKIAALEKDAEKDF